MQESQVDAVASERARLRRASLPRSGVAPLLRESRPRGWRDSLRRRLLGLADLGAALTAILSLALVAGSASEKMLWAAFTLPAWIVLAKLYGLYERDHSALRHLTVDEVPAIFLWSLTATLLTAVFLRVTPAGEATMAEAIRLFLVATVAAVVFRTLARFVWRRLVKPERVLILGDGPLAHATRRKLTLFPDIHAQAIENPPLTALDLLGEPAFLVDLGVDRVILATPSIDEHVLAELVALCKLEHVKLSLVPPVRGMFATAARLSRIADLPILEYNTWDVSRSTLLLKRLLDLGFASVGLLLLSPLFVLIAAAIVVDSPGPVAFSQVRAGIGGRRFRMYKFRTMVPDAEARLAELVPFDVLKEPMFKLPRDPRVTQVGRLLRRSSLDELPQLWNVLRGEMSLVGPRPEQIELVERYAPDQRFRLSVKPGLTGPMQVFGRGNLSFEERLAVEREYIENLSISRDVRILALTVAPVFTGRGAF